MRTTSDEHDIGQVLAGRAQAYEQLVRRHQADAFNLAMRLVRHRELAQEVVQDAFVKAYRALPQFQRSASFGTWLYRIVYNTALSALRKTKSQPLLAQEPYADEQLSDEHENQAANALQQLSQQDQRAYLDKALAQLPPDDQSLLLLFYWDEKSVDEIAELMQLSSANVKVRLMRTRKKLYTLLHRMLKHELSDLRNS